MLPFRTDRLIRICSLAAAIFLLGLASPLSAEEPRGEAVAVDPGGLTERYRVEVVEDGIELAPIERDSAVESIRLEDGESEALVNGKSFSAEELKAFLGADGVLLAELLSLSDDERRRRLGVPPEAEDDEVRVTPRPEDEGAVVGGIPRIPRAPRPPRVFVETDGDDRVSFGQSIRIGPGESAGDAVCIGCAVTVEGEVDGDAVAVGGRVELKPGSTVGGNAVAVGGRVDVASGATVEGDAVAVGASVHIEEGGVVEGQRSSVGWGGGFPGGRHGFFPFDFSGSFADFFWSLLRALILALVAAIVILFVRDPVERTSRRLVEEPWKAIFAGLLTQLLFFPVLVVVTVILAVSIIGIPLLVLVPVAVLAFVIAMLIGYVAVAQSLGRWAKERFGWRLSEPFVVVLAGVLLLQGTTIAGRFVSLFGSVAGILGFTILCLGFFLKYVGWTIGLGGMVLSVLARDWGRLTSRRAGASRAVDLASPDVPDVPEARGETVLRSESEAGPGRAGTETADESGPEVDGAGEPRNSS